MYEFQEETKERGQRSAMKAIWYIEFKKDAMSCMQTTASNHTNLQCNDRKIDS